jgi:hypothetical protein
MYSHPALRCAELFEVDDDTEHNTDVDPDMVSNDGE